MKINDEDILIETLKSIKIIEKSKTNNIINLEKINMITPFFITPLTAYINKSKYNSKIIYPKFDLAKSYLKTIKFPKVSNNKLKNIKSKTYCPLYEIKNEMLGENGEIIDLLKKIIIEEFDLKENINTLMLVFDELMCNIQEHANSKFNCIQTQRYEDKIAISIVDTGVTIPQNYINKGLRGYEDNLELLKLVLKGISTKEEKERGTGIPNSYNLICKALNGSFLIISKDVGFFKLPKKDIHFFNLSDLNLNFEGTIINILFKIPKSKLDYTKYLNKPI